MMITVFAALRQEKRRVWILNSIHAFSRMKSENNTICREPNLR